MNARNLPAEAPRPTLADAGSDLRHRVEAVGSALSRELNGLLGRLPRRPSGPQVLANQVGINVVTASRLLKALGQSDPIACLQMLPGPKPLLQFVHATTEQGVTEGSTAEVEAAIDGFATLIREVAGDRSSFKAMLTTWLPDVRREFEAERRQSIHKARAELDGVSCELSATSMILRPGSEAGRLDVVVTTCMLGIDRIRPDAVVRIGTLPVTYPDQAGDSGRVPTTLAGTPAVDGMEDIRLDQFCNAPPAPLETVQVGQEITYSLGPTGFGPASKVDLVASEVNRDAIEERPVGGDRPPFFFTLPDMPARRLTFDLIVHKDVYAGEGPSLLVYECAGHGPAAPLDPARELDRRRMPQEIEVLGNGLRRLHLTTFPRYVALHEHVFQRLGDDPKDFRTFRLSMRYPLIGFQLMLAFLGDR